VAIKDILPLITSTSPSPRRNIRKNPNPPAIIEIMIAVTNLKIVFALFEGLFLIIKLFIKTIAEIIRTTTSTRTKK